MHWIKLAKTKAENLRYYCEDLEAQNKHLREQLEKISAGVTYNVDKDFTQETRLQLRASRTLAELGVMKNRICDKWVF